MLYRTVYPFVRLLIQRKHDINRSVDPYSRAAQQSGLVSPLLNGIHRRLYEQRVARDDFQRADGSVFVDEDVKRYDPLNSGLTC